jgi:broad specificity phosphatase PhoE
MAARLTLICHGSTDAVRRAVFPRDEPLDDRGRARAAELLAHLPRVDCCWTSPELRARQTAEALGLSATVQPTLQECDYGRWAGKTLTEIAAQEPQAADCWLHDPSAVPHGGESILDLMRRVANWLAEEGAREQRSIAVTHATIIRAAIVHAMDAPPRSFWRIDIRPLSITHLSSSGGGRWNILSSGCTP